jgi:N4-gp56 family major capsid protein
MSQQLWATDSLGGYLANDQLSKKIRHAAQPLQKFRQFCDAEPGIGKSRGEKLLFNKISNISTAGGTISETSTIPKRNFVIRQGELTVTEYANAVPFTLKAQTLAEVSVPDIVKTVLRNDMAKVLDSAAAVQFKTSDYKVVCTSTASSVFSTDGAATATASANMSDKNVRDIIDQLKKLQVPRYDGSNFVCIASTNSIRGLYDYFETKAQNTTMTPLAAGEVGTYYGFNLN